MRMFLLGLAGLFSLFANPSFSQQSSPPVAHVGAIVFCDTESQALRFMQLMTQAESMKGDEALRTVNREAANPLACMYHLVAFMRDEALVRAEAGDLEYRVIPVVVFAVANSAHMLQNVVPAKFFAIIARRVTKV